MNEFYRWQAFITGFFVALFFFLVVVVKVFMMSSWRTWQKSPAVSKSIELPKYQLLETEAEDNSV